MWQKLCKSSTKFRYKKEGTKVKIWIVASQFAGVYKNFMISEHAKKFWEKPWTLGFYDRKEVVKSYQTEVEI